MKRICLFLTLLNVLFMSCQQDNFIFENDNLEQFVNELDEQSAMTRFAEILSQATFRRTDVREFLKREALKKFNYNYDILYVNVKDIHIGNETFGEILNKYAKPGELESIEHSVPTINILIPKITACDISADNLDCTDNETPVVLPNDINNILFLNGSVVDSISKGEIPGFHVFVVNKNSRVIVNKQTRFSNTKYSFIADEYDNSDNKEAVTRNTTLADASVVGNKAILAYSYFYKDDGSKQSMALQRDYIYYGMTPSSTKGNLNQNVTEYISFIEIDPKAYFTITDTKENNQYTDDPEIKQTSTSRKKRDFTQEELINEFWTKGCYNLKIEIATSASNNPMIKRLPISPNDIWDFNLERKYRHSTMFRRSKYTYYIDVNKFTAKRYYLTDKSISLGKWDLSSEALSRTITFVEEDPGETYTETYTVSTKKFNSSKVNGSIKLGLGLGDGNSINTSMDSEASSSTTTEVRREISVTRSNKDDDLGQDIIYFYDAIIESKVGSKYHVRMYNTGTVSFGISAI